MGVLSFYEVEVGLKSRNNGLSGPTGVVPTPPAIAGAFTTLLFVMGKCALLEQGLGGPTVRSG